MAGIENPSTQRLSAEQETLIVDWVAAERGAVISKDGIQWLGDRVFQRDGGEGTLDEEWLDDFLNRHPDIQQRLMAPPHPSHENREPPKSVHPLSGRMRRDRERSLFGDSPPPARQPAPYPGGEIIHHLQHRYIVRHGDLLTKYTTYDHGFSAKEYPNEAAALRFIKEFTTIPVPTVVSASWDRITMEYVEGQTLRQAWPVLTTEQRLAIMTQLRDYISQLRRLRGISIGRLNGEGVLVPCIMTRSGGPFSSVGEFHDFLVEPPRKIAAQSTFWHQATVQLSVDCPIVFTHGDIAARNIVVRDGRIVALLDWEYAGWYPEYWEYTFALRGLDNVDWTTLGSHVPNLFEKRYDLEYILVQFTLTLN